MTDAEVITEMNQLSSQQKSWILDRRVNINLDCYDPNSGY